MRHIYTSLDIGSNTIKIVVCELYKNKLNLLCNVSYKSKGIKKGLITNYDLAYKSIGEAFNKVEDILGIKIKKVITSVPSFNAEYSVIKGAINIEGEDELITNKDIIKCLESAVKNHPYTLREMVTILPVDFTVDNEAFIKNPKGLKGKNLGCRAVLVTTPKKNVYSVISLLENLDIEVVDISLNNIGDMYAFNNSDIEDKICAIINIGNEITDISLYNKSILVKSSVLNMGSKNIDSDISYMYKLDITTSNKLKLKFALAHKKNASITDIIEVKTAYDEVIKINQFELSEIVMSRLIEILEESKKELNLLTSKKIDYIIITGGTSNMQDFEYVVSDIFGPSANIGNVKMLGIRDNIYSSCIGNIIYFLSRLKLKNKNYSMVSEDDAYQISLLNSKKINLQDSVLGKVFDYFFSE